MDKVRSSPSASDLQKLLSSNMDEKEVIKNETENIANDINEEAELLRAIALSIESTTLTTPTQKPKQVNLSKCGSCKKKVGLLGFSCRCGGVFCSHHRHGDDHGCTFDYKTHDIQILTERNVKCVGDKLAKI